MPTWESNGDSETKMQSCNVDCSLKQAMDSINVPGLLLGNRMILSDDNLALLKEEIMSLPFNSLNRCRASGAVRYLVRNLMKSMDLVNLPILWSRSGAPIWPDGVVGSMAHNDIIAVAAVGWKRDLNAVGIDIENVAPLPSYMLDLISLPREQCAISDYPFGSKLLFVIKEAVYKATYPLDHKFLDFHDIYVDIASRIAMTRTGHILTLDWCISSHVFVVATIQNARVITYPQVETCIDPFKVPLH